MYICIHTHTYIYIYIFTHTHTHIYIYILHTASRVATHSAALTPHSLTSPSEPDEATKAPARRNLILSTEDAWPSRVRRHDQSAIDQIFTWGADREGGFKGALCAQVNPNSFFQNQTVLVTLVL